MQCLFSGTEYHDQLGVGFSVILYIWAPVCVKAFQNVFEQHAVLHVVHVG